jgi:hypothetical protein
VVSFAQNILAQPLVVLVTDDTVNEQLHRPELTRTYLMDLTGASRFDYQFPSSLYEDTKRAQVNTMTGPGDVTALPIALETAWSELQAAVHGRYVVTFDLPLVQLQLAATAQQYRLPVPMLVGHSLLDLLLKYARIKDPIDWELDGGAQEAPDGVLCGALEKEDVALFYDASLAPAQTRALHLLHALQAIADGTLSLQEPRRVSVMEDEDPHFSEEEG